MRELFATEIQEIEDKLKLYKGLSKQMEDRWHDASGECLMLRDKVRSQQAKIDKLEKVVEAAIEVRKKKPNVYASTNETEAHQALESLYDALAELNNEKE